MITDIRIQNLRSLRDTGFIKLKPVNILLGSNSSGKSTFLRSFLLMTQSVNKRLRSAISWFDDALVDFGDYEASKNKNASKEENIVFTYILNDIKPFRTIMFRRFPFVYFKDVTQNTKVVLEYSNDSKGTCIKSIDITLHSIPIRIESNGNLKISFEDRPDTTFQYSWRMGGDHELIPILLPEGLDRQKGMEDALMIERILNIARKSCDARLKNTERLMPILLKWNPNKQLFLENLQEFHEIKSLHDNIESWTVEHPAFLELYDGILSLYLYAVWPSIIYDIADFFSNCDYIAPHRAEADRYYRNQGLQVVNIDAYGRNLTEFINSLTDTQRESYNDFASQLLGITLSVKNKAGQQSIVLRKEDNEYNLADVGFGYSQILPIVTKLWFVQQRNRFNSFYYYQRSLVTSLMEQPELHLHPALQGKLTDAILKAAIDRENATDFIIETHSPTIINRIGRRVAEGHVSPDDVNILIFEKNPTTGDSEVKTTQFNEEGIIEDWPYGFFNPDDQSF